MGSAVSRRADPLMKIFNNTCRTCVLYRIEPCFVVRFVVVVCYGCIMPSLSYLFYWMKEFYQLQKYAVKDKLPNLQCTYVTEGNLWWAFI